MVRILRFFGLFILITSSFVNAQNIIVSASTDTSDYLVGDYIYYTIKVKHEEGIRITPPSLNDQLKPLEVVKSLPTTFDEDNKNIQNFNYIISGYDSARVVIPQIPISYFANGSSEAQVAKSNEVLVFIHTLEVIPGQDIKDIKAPIRIPFDWLFWLILILIVILVAVITYFLYKKFKKPKEEARIVKKTPPVPIHIIALRALDKLDEQKLWQQGQIKEYHSEITEIVRRYFEERFHFNSLEMTTNEQMVVLNRVMDNEKLIKTTGEFLQNADMVKFAKFEPLPSVNEAMMKQAYDIVEKTKFDDEIKMGVRSVQ